MANLKKGDIIQIQRKSFFIVDQPYDKKKNTPAVLIAIPDGTTAKPTQLTANANGAPAKASSTNVPASGGSGHLKLFNQVKAQGDLVTAEKTKDKNSV